MGKTDSFKFIGGAFEKKELSSVDRVVPGYYTDGLVDLYGHIVDPAAMMAAIPEYMAWGNIREMHEKPVGVVESMGTPWNHVSAKIVDDNAWKLVEGKVYKGFSVGISVLDGDFISYKDLPSDMFDMLPENLVRNIEKWGEIFVITDLMLIEISIVDRPANPRASFSNKAAYATSILPSMEDKVAIVESMGKKIYLPGGVTMSVAEKEVEVIDEVKVVEAEEVKEVEATEEVVVEEAVVEEVVVEGVVEEVVGEDAPAEVVEEIATADEENTVVVEEVVVDEVVAEEVVTGAEKSLEVDEPVVSAEQKAIESLTLLVAQLAGSVSSLVASMSDRGKVEEVVENSVDSTEVSDDVVVEKSETAETNTLLNGLTDADIAKIADAVLLKVKVAPGKGKVFSGKDEEPEADVRRPAVSKVAIGRRIAEIAAQSAVVTR